MPRRLVLTAEAARQIIALPGGAQRQIRVKLDRLAATGAGDVTAMKGQLGARLRVGNYRAIFYVEGNTIIVTAIGDRKNIYD